LSTQPAAVPDDELASWIAGGAAELRHPLEPVQVQRLVAYLRLIERWNATYNLTAIRDPGDMAVQHILDCLAAAAALGRRRQGRGLRRLIDVGSGAGLPGLVFAVALPETEIVCVDSVGKKAAFITQAIAILEARNATALQARVEALERGVFDVVASRAFASLVDFTRWTRHLLADNGDWMAMKGKRPSEEIAALTAFHVEVEPVVVPRLGAERCLVWIRPDA